jgi:hypothetical protein
MKNLNVDSRPGQDSNRVPILQVRKVTVSANFLDLHPEDGGSTAVRNTGTHLLDHILAAVRTSSFMQQNTNGTRKVQDGEMSEDGSAEPEPLYWNADAAEMRSRNSEVSVPQGSVLVIFPSFRKKGGGGGGGRYFNSSTLRIHKPQAVHCSWSQP